MVKRILLRYKTLIKAINMLWCRVIAFINKLNTHKYELSNNNKWYALTQRVAPTIINSKIIK